MTLATSNKVWYYRDVSRTVNAGRFIASTYLYTIGPKGTGRTQGQPASVRLTPTVVLPVPFGFLGDFEMACYDCGYDIHTVKHHIKGRSIDPDLTVELCPNCHHRHHQGMLLIHNAASRAFLEWMSEQEQQGRYVRWQEREEKLAELGYVPLFDGWDKHPEADRIREQLRAEGWLND